MMAPAARPGDEGSRVTAACNAVTQLNMGEGKTAVIVPMLLAELADGDTLARLYVLASIFNTNFTQLRYKLGGLLGRRVVTLPFTRAMAVTPAAVRRMVALVQRCRERHDVVVSVREHVLSMQLKYFEACSKLEGEDGTVTCRDAELAAALGQLLQLFHTHARDIIDEADEVLHHRFQLVYPLHAPHAPDGEAMRWETAQAVLMSVRTHIAALSRKYPSVVECQPAPAFKAFPAVVRLVDCRDGVLGSAYAELAGRVFDDVFGRKFPFADQDVLDTLETLARDADTAARIRRVVLSDTCTADDGEFLSTVAEGRTAAVLLCLRGLLGQGVLLVSLQKRFRVEYGIAPHARGRPSRVGNSRVIMLAVPFSAKDRAKDNNEFGHTDVAVVLTLLSYYYDGLSDAQLDQVFDRLDYDVSKGDIFDRWQRGDLAEHDVVPYAAVNRVDRGMMTTRVYPVLRHNVDVINYFVGVDVFPVYAKEYRHKIMANAWDIVPLHRPHIVTGMLAACV